MPNLRSSTPLLLSAAVRITSLSAPLVAVNDGEDDVTVKSNGVSIVNGVVEPRLPLIVIRLRFATIAGR